jgi:hypothetical protein
VFAADRSNVAMVLVAGEVVFADGRVLTVDEDALWAELRQRYQIDGATDWEADYSPPS